MLVNDSTKKKIKYYMGIREHTMRINTSERIVRYLDIMLWESKPHVLSIEIWKTKKNMSYEFEKSL